jgi:hypothetical protein
VEAQRPAAVVGGGAPGPQGAFFIERRTRGKAQGSTMSLQRATAGNVRPAQGSTISFIGCGLKTSFGAARFSCLSGQGSIGSVERQGSTGRALSGAVRVAGISSPLPANSADFAVAAALAVKPLPITIASSKLASDFASLTVPASRHAPTPSAARALEREAAPRIIEGYNERADVATDSRKSAAPASFQSRSRARVSSSRALNHTLGEAGAYIRGSVPPRGDPKLAAFVYEYGSGSARLGVW